MGVGVSLEYNVGSLVLDISVGDVECRTILLCVSFNAIYEQCIYNTNPNYEHYFD